MECVEKVGTPLRKICARALRIIRFACMHAQNHLRGTNVELQKTDGLTLPFEDKSFDITYIVHVLIHNSPDRVERIIKEIKKVTRKCSIHMESTMRGAVAKHCYCHDYERLFSINGGKVMLLSEYGKEGKLYMVNGY